MGGVGGELLLRLKRGLEPPEHIIERRGDPVYLIAARRQADTRREVASFADRVRRRDDLIYRAKGASGDQITPGGGKQDEQRQDKKGEPCGDERETAGRRQGEHSPQPQPAALRAPVVEVKISAAAAD